MHVKNSSKTNSGEQRRENPLEALIKLITRNPDPDTPQVDPNEPPALKEHRLRALINLITIETQDDELDRAQKYIDEADPLASDLFKSVDMTPLHRDYLLTKADL